MFGRLWAWTVFEAKTLRTGGALSLPTGARLTYDMGRNPVILFANDWSGNYFAQSNAKVAPALLPFGRVA